ncbi:GH21443 [Drosophila grimshawi]|uniref:GH21443 n=2 Tax=Drosophila grimshawi TaxID=7222 RepID=B4J9G0_DROGR|nr:GH21443 [Drosophila grimshawi]
MAEFPPSGLDTLKSYLESHDLAGVGNTKQCFVKYLPQLEQVGATWSTEYSGCQQNATTLRSTLLSNVGGFQQTIRKEALRIGSYIDSCLNSMNVIDYFNCFAKLSNQQLVSMYFISANASEIALSLDNQLNTIDVERYICSNRTEESYVLGTARIFDALDKCLEQSATLAKATD